MQLNPYCSRCNIKLNLITRQNHLNMNLGTTEILLLVLLVLLLFGGKKIPELMKGMGKGVKSFKDGLNGKDDDTPAAES